MAGFRAHSISLTRGNDGLSCACLRLGGGGGGGTVLRKEGPDMAEINSPGDHFARGTKYFVTALRSYEYH